MAVDPSDIEKVMTIMREFKVREPDELIEIIGVPGSEKFKEAMKGNFDIPLKPTKPQDNSHSQKIQHVAESILGKKDLHVAFRKFPGSADYTRSFAMIIAIFQSKNREFFELGYSYTSQIMKNLAESTVKFSLPLDLLVECMALQLDIQQNKYHDQAISFLNELALYDRRTILYFDEYGILKKLYTITKAENNRSTLNKTCLLIVEVIRGDREAILNSKVLFVLWKKNELLDVLAFEKLAEYTTKLILDAGPEHKNFVDTIYQLIKNSGSEAEVVRHEVYRYNLIHYYKSGKNMFKRQDFDRLVEGMASKDTYVKTSCFHILNYFAADVPEKIYDPLAVFRVIGSVGLEKEAKRHENYGLNQICQYCTRALLYLLPSVKPNPRFPDLFGRGITSHPALTVNYPRIVSMPAKIIGDEQVFELLYPNALFCLDLEKNNERSYAPRVLLTMLNFTRTAYPELFGDLMLRLDVVSVFAAEVKYGQYTKMHIANFVECLLELVEDEKLRLEIKISGVSKDLREKVHKCEDSPSHNQATEVILGMDKKLCDEILDYVDELTE